jgi:hypothetical protein
VLSAVNCWGCQMHLYSSHDETRQPPSRDELRERWLYLCPDCRYEAEHGSAKRVEAADASPRHPQDETLFDAGVYYEPRRRKH